VLRALRAESSLRSAPLLRQPVVRTRPVLRARPVLRSARCEHRDRPLNAPCCLALAPHIQHGASTLHRLLPFPTQAIGVDEHGAGVAAHALQPRVGSPHPTRRQRSTSATPLVDCLGCSVPPRASTVLASRHDQAPPSPRAPRSTLADSIGEGLALDR